MKIYTIILEISEANMINGDISSIEEMRKDLEKEVKEGSFLSYKIFEREVLNEDSGNDKDSK